MAILAVILEKTRGGRPLWCRSRRNEDKLNAISTLLIQKPDALYVYGDGRQFLALLIDTNPELTNNCNMPQPAAGIRADLRENGDQRRVRMIHHTFPGIQSRGIRPQLQIQWELNKSRLTGARGTNRAIPEEAALGIIIAKSLMRLMSVGSSMLSVERVAISFKVVLGFAQMRKKRTT